MKHYKSNGILMGKTPSKATDPEVPSPLSVALPRRSQAASPLLLFIIPSRGHLHPTKRLDLVPAVNESNPGKFVRSGGSRDQNMLMDIWRFLWVISLGDFHGNFHGILWSWIWIFMGNGNLMDFNGDFMGPI